MRVHSPAMAACCTTAVMVSINRSKMKTQYLKTISHGCLHDGPEEYAYARFEGGIPASCPKLAPNTTIVDYAPHWYTGFNISGYDWLNFFAE